MTSTGTGTEAVLAATNLDHVVWAVPDLAAGVARFAELTGVEPVPGGSHPGAGTANYLVALGEPGPVPPRADRHSYLEILGPDPEQPGVPPERTPFGYGRLALTEGPDFAPRLIAWAVHPADPDGAVARARAAGFDPGGLEALSRHTPDGTLLAWRLTRPLPMPFDGVVPFVIDWGTTPHPATAELPVLGLAGLHVAHPDAAGATRALGSLGVPLEARAAASPALYADLVTPRGAVTL